MFPHSCLMMGNTCTDKLRMHSCYCTFPRAKWFLHAWHYKGFTCSNYKSLIVYFITYLLIWTNSLKYLNTFKIEVAHRCLDNRGSTVPDHSLPASAPLEVHVFNIHSSLLAYNPELTYISRIHFCPEQPLATWNNLNIQHSDKINLTTFKENCNS